MHDLCLILLQDDRYRRSTILLNEVLHFELSVEYHSADANFLNMFVTIAKLERAISIGNAENGYMRYL